MSGVSSIREDGLFAHLGFEQCESPKQYANLSLNLNTPYIKGG